MSLRMLSFKIQQMCRISNCSRPAESILPQNLDGGRFLFNDRTWKCARFPAAKCNGRRPEGFLIVDAWAGGRGHLFGR